MMRQGDVLIRQISKVPEGAVKKDNVLAYGEATGHKHRIVGQALVLLHEGKQYVDVTEEAELVHEEHSTLNLPKGVYEVIQQREYDTVEGIRMVVD